MCHNGLWVYSSDDTEFIRRYSWWGDYSRIFTEATWPVGADTNWGWKKSHRFHRYTQIFLGTFFLVTQIFYSSDDTEFIRRYSWWDDYSRIFAEATYSVGADTPWGWKKSHRFHRYTQIFSSEFFCHADFADDADFFIHRMTRNLFGDFLRRQLLTDFHGGDLSGRCRYPLELEYVPQRKICVYLWNLWDEIIPTKKNLCISVKSVGRNNPHEEKSASSAKSAWQKTIATHIGREPLASGQISAKIRE